MYHTVREGSEEGAPGGAEDTEAAEKKTSIRLRRTKRDCAKWGETREGERAYEKEERERRRRRRRRRSPTNDRPSLPPAVLFTRELEPSGRPRPTRENITTIERAQNRNKIEKHK